MDQETGDLNPSGVPLDLLKAQLGTLYGCLRDPELEFIREGENTTYRVSEGNSHYALRLHRPGYQTVKSVASEVAWTRSLREAGVNTPAAIEGVDNRTVQHVETDLGDRMAVLFEWVAGEPLRALENLNLWYRLGSTLAAIHAHGKVWRRPDWFTRRSWDLEGLVGDEPHWGDPLALGEWSAEDEQSISDARELVRSRLSTFGQAPDRFGLIHADLGFDNVLARPDGSTTLLDFDDGGFGWFMYDIAVPLFTLEPRGPDLVERVRDSLMSGYRSVTPLPESHLIELPTFMMTRRLVTLGWTLSRGNTDHAKEQRKWRLSTAGEAARDFVARAS